MNNFATRLIRWQRLHGRHNLPWQGADAYRIWLSEIMLQQTQVATVMHYYQRFIAQFPDIASLASACEDQVLACWSGMGYYARARNLHRAARIIMQQHDGIFPKDFGDIVALPGIGRSTAAAISVFAFRQRCAILDGNVKRVLARCYAIEGYPGEKKTEARLWRQAETLLPMRGMVPYTQGLMDIGSLVCTRSKPQCTSCPLQQDCVAYQSDRVAQLPAPRPRKTLPEKHTTFLLLLNGSNIMLEKRPASGIWGGLWCLPQMDGVQARAYCEQQLGVNSVQGIALPIFTHTFTHFKLHITPLCVRVIHKPNEVQELGRVWRRVEDAMSMAIPAPVRKLLQGIQVCPMPM